MYSPASKLDIIVFPEMAFTGYNFAGPQEALPLAVAAGEGEEFQFASKIAVSLNSYVAFGYIERVSEKGEVLLYNAAAIIDRTGKLILNYRKSHLYYNDTLWAR
jgi:protein N-terminal amidase